MKRSRAQGEILISLPEMEGYGPPMQVHRHPPQNPSITKYYQEMHAIPRHITAEEMEASYVEPSQNVNRSTPLGSWLKPTRPWPPVRKPVRAGASTPIREVTRKISHSASTPQRIGMASQTQLMSGSPASQTQLMTGVVRRAESSQRRAELPHPEPPRKRRALRCVYGDPTSSQPGSFKRAYIYSKHSASQGDIHPFH